MFRHWANTSCLNIYSYASWRVTYYSSKINEQLSSLTAFFLGAAFFFRLRADVWWSAFAARRPRLLLISFFVKNLIPFALPARASVSKGKSFIVSKWSENVSKYCRVCWIKFLLLQVSFYDTHIHFMIHIPNLQWLVCGQFVFDTASCYGVDWVSCNIILCDASSHGNAYIFTWNCLNVELPLFAGGRWAVAVERFSFSWLRVPIINWSPASSLRSGHVYVPSERWTTELLSTTAIS